MSVKPNKLLPYKMLETEQDVLCMANEGCLKLFHVNLSILNTALEAKGMSISREGMLLLMLAAITDFTDGSWCEIKGDFDKHEAEYDPYKDQNKFIATYWGNLTNKAIQ